MAEAVQIKEGFLCPICVKDYRSPKNLIAHFQEKHSEEQDLFKSLKDLYGKAKKKILKAENTTDIEVPKNTFTFETDDGNWTNEDQVLGQTRSHIDYFKAVRREKLEHRTSEVNKLIIRLDRLMQSNSTDKRNHEQELVEWLDGTTVTRCPSCASSFNITRRQHHCRLCGCIMCNSCSYFLPFTVAQQIVTPVGSSTKDDHNASKDNHNLRICNHCLDILESRRKVQLKQILQPIICQLYSHLQKLKTQVQTSADLYIKMHNSLTKGERVFQLQDGQSLRSTIAKQAETIDTLSKKIAQLPNETLDPKSAMLYNSIRRATIYYIKNYLSSLPDLPTVEQIEQIAKERSLLTDIDHSQLKEQDFVIQRVTVATGWSPVPNVNSSQSVTNEDPIVEQINIVENFIKQARQAQRYDEVLTLEENLKFLKRMHSQKMNSL